MSSIQVIDMYKLKPRKSVQSVKYEMEYLLIWRWCWITMFFSWIVSSKAVARDLRSVMDCGVTGKLQPFSSDSNNSFTAHTSLVTVKVQTPYAAFKLRVYKNTFFFSTTCVYVLLTLFSREHPSQCTAVSFPTDFRVFLTFQGILKSVKSISERERFLRKK